ncbi:kinesin-like protein KIF20A [Entelurus aequoreus]|uniref:kinesin-like protein KIF20A n=1 Tax=Entelurus aequoreus TaxID=161455 RepID=UPI002B1D8F11|nr:kinesin-like protein KIF20A [Entelurus aequoreus]
MMESCLAGKPERVGPVEVEDIKRDLQEEFSTLPNKEDASIQSENLQVYLRVRPFTASDNDESQDQDCVTLEGPNTVVLKAPRTSQSTRQGDKLLPQTAQRFTFTQVFGPDASQRRVFEGSVHGLVRDVLQGENCLVFTYGVTNAGKTFTFLGPDHDSGLLPRSLWAIFNSIQGRLYTRCDLKPQRCRDFSRLTPDQQTAESSSKKNLLRMLKENHLTSARSTCLDSSSLSSDCSVNSVCESNKTFLDVPSNVGFSVWVSFCEIYKDNIHDLLEQVPLRHVKRTVLRVSQDVKGNSFIKDLKWIQVSSLEEAYRVMKIGKKNQSFSSTRLNHLSSRSHSIFSIRILRVEDSGVPRVLGISELALCDLAGSERCSRTHNTGERLKEAGNINNSLLTLGKCINAMRLNQQAKIQHHIPFRESKLTHFLQFFFCGAGKVTMVVNINQSAACVDETLNVLKFSALAQKVVVLSSSRPVSLDASSHRSAMELSIIIDQAEPRRTGGRKSSLLAWESGLEDVAEDEDGEEWDQEDQSEMEGTVLEGNKTLEDQQKWDKEAALRLVVEAQIREEISAEFKELFMKMEKDFSERLEKEREILEERAEKKVQILQNLSSKTWDLSSSESSSESHDLAADWPFKEVLVGIIGSVSQDLDRIRADAETVHRCLKLEQQSCDLQANKHVHARTCERESLDPEQEEEEEEEEGGRHCTKREKPSQESRAQLEAELKRQQEEVQKLKKEVQKLTAQVHQCPKCDLKQQESSTLSKEKKALVQQENQGVAGMSEQLTATKARLQDAAVRTGQEVQEEAGVFHANMAELRKESQAALERAAHKSQVIQELQREKKRLEGELACSADHCERLLQQVARQKAEELDMEAGGLARQKAEELDMEAGGLARQKAEELDMEAGGLARKKAEELDMEAGGLARKLQKEEARRYQDQRQIEELQRVLCQKDKLLEDLVIQKDTMRQELQRVKEELQRQEAEEQKENVQLGLGDMEEKLRAEEKQVRKCRRTQEVDPSKELKAATAPMEQEVAPFRNNTADIRTWKDKSAARKRKGSEVEGLASSDNKRNGLRKMTQQTLDSFKDVICQSQLSLECTAALFLSEQTHNVTMATKAKRGRKKLYQDAMLLISPNMTCGGSSEAKKTCGGAGEAKESDHVIIKRQLRSKTSRK